MTPAADWEDSDSDSDDEDWIPEKKVGWKQLNVSVVSKRKKKRKQVQAPDVTELSLAKPPPRLSTEVDLSASAVVGASQQSHAISRLGLVKVNGAPPEAKAETIHGRKACTRGTPDDPRVAQYREFYAAQLPGMPFYDDEYHVTLSLDVDHTTVLAGATFSFVDLTSNSGDRLLIVDILGLAVCPGPAERRGTGSLVVSALKAIARQEAQALSARPLLLTQADLGCVPFWAKNGFARALDANALVRSLRRDSGATIFTSSVPMAHLMQSSVGRRQSVGVPRKSSLEASQRSCSPRVKRATSPRRPGGHCSKAASLPQKVRRKSLGAANR